MSQEFAIKKPVENERERERKFNFFMYLRNIATMLINSYIFHYYTTATSEFKLTDKMHSSIMFHHHITLNITAMSILYYKKVLSNTPTIIKKYHIFIESLITVNSLSLSLTTHSLTHSFYWLSSRAHFCSFNGYVDIERNVNSEE